MKLDIDIWDAIALAGAGLVGGGVWSMWGAPWACIFWGVLLLSVAGVRTWLVTRKGVAG